MMYSKNQTHSHTNCATQGIAHYFGPDCPHLHAAWERLIEEGFDPRHYMAMLKEGAFFAFKHRDTRQYVRIPIE